MDRWSENARVAVESETARRGGGERRGRQRGALFFRQGRVRGGLLGVHHTRGIYAGIKAGERGRGERMAGRGCELARRACAIFIARTTPAWCYSNPLLPPLGPDSLSVNRPGPAIVCAEASQPRLAPIRANKRGFLIFFPGFLSPSLPPSLSSLAPPLFYPLPLSLFFFFFRCAPLFRLCEAANENLPGPRINASRR